MKISLVTPASQQSKCGNRQTAVRWAKLLSQLGHTVTISTSWDASEATDCLVALHAWRSADSVDLFRATWPTHPLVVALTGTDIYKFQASHPEVVLRSMALADRLVCLHDAVHHDIPPEFKPKLHVAHQFAPPLKGKRDPRKKSFDVCVVGHLREEKDPMRAAYAARSMPEDSKLRVIHLGKAMDEGWERQARNEMESNPRYVWRGEVSYGAVRQEYRRTHLMVISSVMEGGANVVSEAAVAGVPIVASDIAGNIGLLGEDHPGLYKVQDTGSLSQMLIRCEQEPAFLSELTRRSKLLRKQFTPARERDTWRKVLQGLEVPST